MKLNLPRIKENLATALSLFDKKKATELCGQLMDFLNSSNAEAPAAILENILQQLRNKRMFVLMQRVADCCIQTGRQTFKIRRQYAQSLIEQEIYTGALSVLTELKNDTANIAAAAGENSEATGLLGRVYKQLYVNADKPGNPQFVLLLKQSLQHYWSVYALNPENSLWHGINMVALLRRAERDKVAVSGFRDAATIAKEILVVVEKKVSDKQAFYWDYSTAAEACIALNKPGEAQAWANKYINTDSTDAFEIGSTLRQLEEVWQLVDAKGIGKQILPLLKAALLKKEGTVLMDTGSFKKQLQAEATYAKNYERVFGDDSYKPFAWYLKGKDRCLPVAKIDKRSGGGQGTGFLLEGKYLHESIKDELVLLTNAHVVSTRPDENKASFQGAGALRPEDAVVVLETIDSKTELLIEKIFWSSPVKKLDVSVLLFDAESSKKLRQLTENVTFYPIAKRLPATDGKQRVYIIGHPAGGTLQISLQDNVLLAQKAPFMHYRTPTAGGSSGSPVFNDSWDLVGIHHAGSRLMPKLDEPGEVHEANEGIWIQSIISEIGKKK
jgi:hypothetical protein